MWEVDCKRDSDWIADLQDGLRTVGFSLVHNFLDKDVVVETERRLHAVAAKIEQEVGRARLEQAGELGVYRVMGKFDPYFFKLLELPEMLAIVDAAVAPTAILHLQNGFILPSYNSADRTPRVYQNTMHMDFNRVLNGYRMSVNVLVTLTDFTKENGGTLVVPGTQQLDTPPSANYCQRNAVAVECPAGTAIVFDSTLWHSAGANVSGRPRLAINHQFTRSYLKQQIDLVRALGEDVVRAQKPRTQQMLGYYTRVPTCHDEFYRSGNDRLYRGGQG